MSREEEGGAIVAYDGSDDAHGAAAVAGKSGNGRKRSRRDMECRCRVRGDGDGDCDGDGDDDEGFHSESKGGDDGGGGKDGGGADAECREGREAMIGPDARLPGYLSEAFAELYAEDGLVVMGRGLGWMGLLASFARFYADAECGHAALAAPDGGDDDGGGSGAIVCKDEDDGKDGAVGENGTPRRARRRRRRPPLVFVLGLRESERSALLSTLASWGTSPDLLPRLITNESGPSKDRAALYARGGVFVVTSRILIVDLLTNVADVRNVEGLLVAHAERAAETSTEAFIVRIFRTQKYHHYNHCRDLQSGVDPPRGFVKAFTDDPSCLMAGFAKVEKILKALHVRKMYLYPRFRASVADELDGRRGVDEGGGEEGGGASIDVEELHQSLSPKMKEIQVAIAACVRACLRELKRSTTLVDASALSSRGGGSGDFGGDENGSKSGGCNDDTLELTVENCVTSHFDRIISRQLQNDWHRLKPSTKQVVHDLRTLRTLFQSLVQYDAVQFWRLLESIKSMSSGSRTPSMWLLTPAGEVLYERAKDRVYRVSVPPPPPYSGAEAGDNGDGIGDDERCRKQQRSAAPVGRLTPVLEENPKEGLLRQVLTEIENGWKEKVQKRRLLDGGKTYDSGTNVLLMVKDERALESIRSYLAEGGRRTMALKWLRYLEGINEKSRSVLRSGRGAGAGGHGYGGGPDVLSGESRLLVEEEGRVRQFLFGVERVDAYRRREVEEEAARRRRADELLVRRRKRRRVAEERSRGLETGDDVRRRAMLDEAVEESGRVVAEDIDHVSAAATSSSVGRNGGVILSDADEGDDDDDDGNETSSDDEDDLAYKIEPVGGLSLFIRAFSNLDEGRSSLLLRDVRPVAVVLYDSDPSFVRALEIYANCARRQRSQERRSSSAADDAHDHDPLRVFFLIYEASAEEKNFLHALEREKSAFERLIAHQKRMVLPLHTFDGTTQEMQLAGGGTGGSYAGGTLPLSMDTRTGRGKKDVSKERRDVAVDVREFRSALPSILHRGGMRIAPVTLTVGDFVLSNVHCVERKSISDLFGSFASGRLYSQAEAMSKHYKCPSLLIEFDPAKTFSLQSAKEIGGEIRVDSICSKMTLLVMHFPKLRILWSRSTHETLKLFKKLKRNHQEVDVERAVEIGSNESLDELLFGGEAGGVAGAADDDDEEEDEINDAARSMLLRLPGVNAHNARKIMGECDSIAELTEMSRDNLKRLAGPVAGQKLFTFFRQRFTT